MARENHASAVLGLVMVALDPEILEVERHPLLFSAVVEPNLACQQGTFTVPALQLTWTSDVSTPRFEARCSTTAILGSESL
jgi:hypothetical protein